MGDEESDWSEVQHPAAVSRAVQQLLAKHRNRNRTSSTNSNVDDASCNVNLNWDNSATSRCSALSDRGSGTELGSASSCVDVNGNAETDDEEEEALSFTKLRCQSVRTEIIAEKYRRKNRCADYPGFAFGSSLFSSDTMMKFNIIKNELHNIMHNQLRRVSNTFTRVSTLKAIGLR